MSPTKNRSAPDESDTDEEAGENAVELDLGDSIENIGQTEEDENVVSLDPALGELISVPAKKRKLEGAPKRTPLTLASLKTNRKHTELEYDGFRFAFKFGQSNMIRWQCVVPMCRASVNTKPMEFELPYDTAPVPEILCACPHDAKAHTSLKLEEVNMVKSFVGICKYQYNGLLVCMVYFNSILLTSNLCFFAWRLCIIRPSYYGAHQSTWIHGSKIVINDPQ